MPEPAERAELRAAVRGLVERLGGTDATRRAMDTNIGFDEQTWHRLCTEIGVAGIGIDESYGGQGASFVEVALVAAELARSVLAVPFLATAVLAATAIDAGGDDDDRAALLPLIAGGAPGALAYDDPSAAASRTAGGWVVSGDYAHVIDGAAAELLVIAVDSGDGPALFVVEGDTARRTPVATLDQTRRQALVKLDAAPARRLAGNGAVALARALDAGRVALAAEAAAGARRCLEMTVDYAKVREQFGRPIGSFQALKHRIADLHVEVETATSTAEHAAWTVAHDPESLPLVAAMAKAYCADAYAHVAQEAIQLHGGIGFTWEHEAHLHLKRAWSTRQLLGTPRVLRARVADLAGLT